jgi:hypothetical protein
MAAPPNPAPAGRTGAARPRVIYVMGAGRSGSTILGVALGNCEHVVFAGELDKWALRRGRPKRDDEQIERFWAQVLDQVDGAEELFAIRTHRYLERSSALLRPAHWTKARKLRATYRRVNEELYRAIANTAGATHVVDTGHYPLRARELQGIAGIELYLLLLIREPRSVVASFAREDAVERRFNPLTTNLYLWLTHMLSLLTFLRQPRARRMLVRHETFLEDPQGVLAGILEQAGCDSPLPALDALRIGVPLMGNRLIEADTIALDERPARPPQSGSAVGASLLTRVMQGPWMLVFSLLRPAAGVLR